MPTIKIPDGRGGWIPIPTVKGADGKTPVKGVDYFTPKDIEDLKIQFKKEIFEAQYPVGSIYLSTKNENPSVILGFGDWRPFAGGRTLVGVQANDPDFATIGKLGGSKEMQAHSHTFAGSATDGTVTDPQGVRISPTLGTSTIDTSIEGTGNAGNMPPYITVAMWRRVR